MKKYMFFQDILKLKFVQEKNVVSHVVYLLPFTYVAKVKLIILKAKFTKIEIFELKWSNFFWSNFSNFKWSSQNWIEMKIYRNYIVVVGRQRHDADRGEQCVCVLCRMMVRRVMCGSGNNLGAFTVGGGFE